MKLLITSILFFLSLNLFAQFTVGTEWVYSIKDIGDPYFEPAVITISKDTVINDQTWLVLSGIDGCGLFKSSAIREEGNKVFLLDFPSGEIILLYDFDLEEGDSYEIDVSPGSNFPIFYTITIDSVRIENIGGKDYKIQYVDNPEFGPKIIEGVGCNKYFVPQGNICDPQYFGIRCFTSPNDFVDFDLEHECDALISAFPSSSREIELDTKITIYPNPSILDFLYLNNDSDARIEKIEIFDLEGRNVKSNSSYFSMEKIDLNDLVNGSYFLRITTNKGVVLKKFLKID